MNSFTGIGRLTRDPEVKYSPTGVPTTKFQIAIDRGYGENKKTDFIPITVFGRDAAPDGTSRSQLAENCAQYLTKGKLAGVTGSLRYSSWEKDGQKRSAIEVIADRVDFLSPKEQEESE